MRAGGEERRIIILIRDMEVVAEGRITELLLHRPRSTKSMLANISHREENMMPDDTRRGMVGGSEERASMRRLDIIA